MKTLETILRENKEASNIMLARAETEIKYLEQAKLGEAFSCLPVARRAVQQAPQPNEKHLTGEIALETEAKDSEDWRQDSS